MLPMLRVSADARIVNVSSGVGSLSTNTATSSPYRTIFGPGYSAYNTALNAMTLAMEIQLEGTGIKVNLVPPGFTSTNLNYEGTESVEEGSREVVRIALLGPDGPTVLLHRLAKRHHPAVIDPGPWLRPGKFRPVPSPPSAPACPSRPVPWRLGSAAGTRGAASAGWGCSAR